ncbi:MAG: hypothetical protein JRN45_00615 [Nitrososphaerota archaeon]|nr:hypothetical protein [Nitrososphaerota archaeon]
MSKSKLAKKLNRLVYEGDIDGLRDVVAKNRALVRKCLPYLAGDPYRSMVVRILSGW